MHKTKSCASMHWFLMVWKEEKKRKKRQHNPIYYPASILTPKQVCKCHVSHLTQQLTPSSDRPTVTQVLPCFIVIQMPTPSPPSFHPYCLLGAHMPSIQFSIIPTLKSAQSNRLIHLGQKFPENVPKNFVGPTPLSPVLKHKWTSIHQWDRDMDYIP